MIKKILILSLLFSSQFSLAQEEVDICAKYRNTGKSYSVEATILSGDALNYELTTYKYKSVYTYVVIFWSDEQVSIIEIPQYNFSPSFLPVTGEDQRGYKWEITENTGFLGCI